MKIHEYLRQLMKECGESISGLSQRAGIDRPTLSKILSGQRFPSRQNMERLLPALKASPAQRRELLQLFSLSRVGSGRMAQRQHIYSLLETIYSLQDQPAQRLAASPALPPDGGQVQMFQGQQNILMIFESLARSYLAKPQSQPLMISPNLGGRWLRLLAALIHWTPHPAVTLWHLSQLVKQPDKYEDAAVNLRRITTAFPFLFQEGLHYVLRYFYGNSAGLSPGELFPQYLIFPDCLFAISEDEKSACLLRSSELVACCRRQFEHLFRAESAPFLHQSSLFYYQAILEENSRLDQKKRPTVWLHHQPPLVLCLDGGMIDDCLAEDLPDRAAQAQLFKRRLGEVQALPLTCFFCEEGLRAFLATGRIFEIPSQLYSPLSVPARRLLLRRLSQLCRSGRLRLFALKPSALLPSPDIYVNIVQETGLLFYQKGREEGSISFCSFQEPTVTEAFWDFCSYLVESGLTYSQEETAAMLEISEVLEP